MLHLPRREFLASTFGAFAGVTISSAFGAPQVAATVPNSLPEPKSLFLTWWRDPTTTMVVQWIGPELPGAILEYAALSNDDVWRRMPVAVKPFPGTDQRVHRVELTGLQPGTEYEFRIVGWKSTYRFRTMPAKATNAIQFVSGGDSGIGSHAQLTNLLAAKQDPYFALIGGDLAYDNGKAPLVFSTFLENYSKSMRDTQKRLIPLISCPGNHEVDPAQKDKRVGAASYLSVFDGLFQDTSYGVLDFGDYMSIALLDSGHIQPVKGEQTVWLEKTLRARQGVRHLFAASHVPAYPSFRTMQESGADNRKYWCPLFENLGVDFVLEHHDHTFKRTHPLKDGVADKYGVPYLGDGSWGRIRALKKPEDRPYLAAWGESYHMTVHRFEGNQRFHVALKETGQLADVYMTSGKRPAKRG